MTADKTLEPLGIGGENYLWRRVIEQAIEDAARPVEQKYLWQQIEVLDARSWINNPNADFALVCELAELEAWQVRAYAKQKIAQIVAARPKASGKRAGVVSDFSHKLRDQSPRAPREIAEIGFSRNRKSS